jgi:hypothetical protein
MSTKWTDDQLIESVKQSICYKQVAEGLGLSTNGSGGYTTFKRRILELNLNTDHFIKGGASTSSNKNRLSIKNLPIEDFLMVSKSCGQIKERLLKEGYLKNICNECGQPPEWNGKPLTLQMDHIDGNNKNNKLNNLRILCPHCHTQTSTYGSKKLKKINLSKRKYDENGNLVYFPRNMIRKVERPSKDDLSVLVWTIPTNKIAKQYGVTDKAIEKWCKYYKISKPPRGYWQKKSATIPYESLKH